MHKTKGRILYAGAFELPDKNAASHRVLNNAKVLRECGYDVVFCDTNREISSPSTAAHIVEGFECFSIPYPSSTVSWIKQMCSISVYTDIIERYPDIKCIIVYNFHAIPYAKLKSFAKKRGIKLVVDCTEWYDNRFSLNPIKFIKCIDTFLCMRHFYKKSDGIIAISTFLYDYYSSKVFTVKIPPLVDLSDEKYCNNAKHNEIPVLVYIGSPSASKEALGDVVECLNKMKDINFKLEIVGIDKEAFISIYGTLPESDKIIFRGRVPHKEALEILKAADYSVIIRPRSRVNMAGFPTKFVEAVSCGTAVIVNDISNVSDYLKDGKNGYLVNENKLEEELKRILFNRERPVVEKDLFDYKQYFSFMDELLKGIGLSE